jgi:Domain of unknown function (DUF4124)
MHPRRYLLLLSALAAVASQAAVIYKWTDPQGVVHYSDQPTPGAEKIVTSGGISTYSAAKAGQKGPSGTGKPNTAGPAQIAVVSPSAEQTFFGDDPITAHVSVTPALKDTQSISWTLNGGAIADAAPNATTIVLQNLDRGTYAIAATLTDSDTGDTITASPVTFYVRQPSALSPQHKAATH